MVRAAHDYPLIREYSTATSAHVRLSGKAAAATATPTAWCAATHWDIGLSKTGYISEAGRCLVMQVRARGEGPDRGAARFLGQAFAHRRRQPHQEVARDHAPRRPDRVELAAFRAGRHRGAVAARRSRCPQVFLRCARQPPVRAHLPPARVLPDARRARAHARGISAPSRASPAAAAQLIEYGSGESVKTPAADPRAAARRSTCRSTSREDALRAAAAKLAREFPWLRIAPVAGDFSRPLDLPALARPRPARGVFPRLDHRQPHAAGGARLPAHDARPGRPARRDAGRRRPEEGRRRAARGLQRRARASPRLSTSTCWRASTASSAPTSTCAASRTTRSTTPPPAASRCTWSRSRAQTVERRAAPLSLRRRRDHPHREFLQVLGGGVRRAGARGPASAARRSGPTARPVRLFGLS